MMRTTSLARRLLSSHISELEIEDTWFVAGVCGTGTNTLVAKDIFVSQSSSIANEQDRKRGISSAAPIPVSRRIPTPYSSEQPCYPSRR